MRTIKTDKVLVLLSTYNGEKFLEKQLESIFEQKDVEVKILARDDGSTDKTLDILKKYAGEKLEYYVGENIGVAKSFLDLINNSYDNYDFYAYADQDDVWNENKLIKSINKIKENSVEVATLCMGTYDVVDANLNYLYTRDIEAKREFTIFETIVYRSPSGCTMVFNKKLRNIMKGKMPEYVRMHDFWTLLTVQAHKGQICVIEEPLMKYRIHGENTVGLSPNLFIRIKRLIRSALKNNNERQRQVISLFDVYSEQLDSEMIEILSEVKNYKKSLRNRIKFMFDKRYKCNSGYINFLFKISVLLGVF